MEQKGNKPNFDTFADDDALDELLKHCADFSDKAIPYDELKAEILKEDARRKKKQRSLLNYCCAAASFVILLGAGIFALGGLPGMHPEKSDLADPTVQSQEQQPDLDPSFNTQPDTDFPRKDGYTTETSPIETAGFDADKRGPFLGLDKEGDAAKYSYTSLDSFLSEATGKDSPLLRDGRCFVPSAAVEKYELAGIVCGDAGIAFHFYYGSNTRAAAKVPAASEDTFCIVWEKYSDAHWFNVDNAVALDKASSIYVLKDSPNSDRSDKLLSEYRYLVHLGADGDIFSGRFPIGMTENECVGLMEFELVMLNTESR